MILVDPPVRLCHDERGPFNQDNMLRFMRHHLPERVCENWNWSLFDHTKAVLWRDHPVLHDPDKINASDMLHLLIGYIVFETWQRNVQHLENRLNFYRHEAIASPSLETFAPLTSLRRNFADIEDAIRSARNESVSATGHIDLEALFENNDAKPEATEVQYDLSLEKVKSLSTLLNNEIQFVIGSVTVQVPHFFETHELALN